MDRVRVETLVAFTITVAAVTILTIFNKPIPVAIVGVLGTLSTAVLPALFPPKSGDQ